MESKERTVAPIANSAAEWDEAMRRMATKSTPSFFHIRAKLPKVGRTNQVLGASKYMNVVLKTYASGGENEIHAHTNEDHVFVVLQGGAVFYGPRGEEREVGKNDCVLVPSGAFYRFTAKEEEPLVMLRVGAAVDPDSDILARIDIDNKPFDGYSEKNKETPYELYDDRWFE
ncbi:cupin domain-containing protein [Pusillimonas sp.]|uniref:cupin domain-containing protein n=1 Tax=Pusillimonas sp. TaxID=3040095 RepID=UPI0029B40F8C|nr:cupin domain-containing protein [Pusillimonas sp.]MDX3895567.1 cupin domain-containing protein [Pusillimonas sp.]